MNLLLDTHVLLWSIRDDDRLHPEARSAIADGRNRVFVSAASTWEIVIKKGLGKLRAPDDLLDQVRQARFEPLSIDLGHTVEVGRLPMHHADPFDRVLVAQARTEGLHLVTRDPKITRYDVAVLDA